jgi:hypothetical protein
MDPALREYLDRMELNANVRSDSFVATQQGLLQQITAQIAHLHHLADSHPYLEAWFAQLQGAVADLQRHQYKAKVAEGRPAAPHLAASAALVADGEFNGQSDRDIE